MRLLNSILFFLLLIGCTNAQSFTISGTVRDLFTENGIDSTRVELLQADSSLLAVTLAEIPFTEEQVTSSVHIMRKVEKDGAAFTLKVTAAGHYIIRCKKLGYVTALHDFTIEEGKRKGSIDVGDIYMHEQSQQLGEAVVKGTRIQMFYKGDTLVYNANAFVLPDGSMLDDLVKQLPGAEIRDGNVYVNGRLVENLLLSGKDFFNGNPQAALKNLPAYVVSRVKVYEKEGNLIQTAGTDMGDKQYVMDVYLKREYIGTYIGQLKAGYGTEDRYEAGLFAMRFDDRQSFSLSGDFNNLNTDNTYGQNGGYSSSKPNGLHKRNYASADYRFEPNGRVKLTANAVFEHRDNRLTQGTASETYLTGGNTYGRSLADSHDRSVNVNGNTKLTLRPRQGRFYEVGYAGGYKHTDNTSASRSASYDAQSSTQSTEALLDSTFYSPSIEAIRSITLNRLQNSLTAESDFSYHRLTTHATRSIVGSNLLDLNGQFYYETNSQEQFDIYHLEYPKTAATSDYRHRYTDRDSRYYNYNLQGKYYWKYMNTNGVNGQITPGYSFAQNFTSTHSPLYRLDWLGGAWAADTTLAVLPSTYEELSQTIDSDNSYFSTRRISRHTVMLDWLHDVRLKNRTWIEFRATLNFVREQSRLDYQRYGNHYHTALGAWLPEPSASIRWRPKADDKGGTKMQVKLQYSSTASQPNLLYLLDITDAANPLYVTVGNPDLKAMRSHKLTLSLNRNWIEKGASLSTSLDYQRLHNLVASEQTYDRESGVCTNRWVNVDGNWMANYKLWCNVPLNAQRNFTMQARMGANYAHSVDLSLSSGEERSQINHVNTLSLSPMLSLQYYFGSTAQISGTVWAFWRNVDGDRPNFERIRATDFIYLIDGWATLPGDIRLQTNLRITSRYGFNDAALNDTRVLWDVSLSRSFKNLTFQVKGCDLFGRNRYTSVVVNAQGRTETFANTIPRYVLFSVTWKFNKAEKSKKTK